MSPADKELKEAIAQAVKMETDGMAFYRKAGETVKSPIGRMMFQSFVKDEENHLKIVNEILQDMFNRSVEEAFVGTPASRIKSIFEENRESLNERLSADPGDIEALDMAMEMERKGYQLYHDASQRAEDEKLKALFSRLAGEEQAHFNMLQNNRDYLSDTGNWMIYEEHGIMDG